MVDYHSVIRRLFLHVGMRPIGTPNHAIGEMFHKRAPERHDIVIRRTGERHPFRAGDLHPGTILNSFYARARLNGNLELDFLRRRTPHHQPRLRATQSVSRDDSTNVCYDPHPAAPNLFLTRSSRECGAPIEVARAAYPACRRAWASPRINPNLFPLAEKLHQLFA